MDAAELDKLVAQIGGEILALTRDAANLPAHGEGLDIPEIASLIDHTLLRADATRADIVQLCREARQYNFASVCINRYWVPLAAAELSGYGR